MIFEPASLTPTPENLCWRTISAPRGSSYRCWSAGPIVPVWVHHNGTASKPCWKRITKGKLVCPWCGVKALRQIGYLPTWSWPEAKRMVLVMPKTAMLSITGITLATPLVANQAVMKNQPAVVRVEDADTYRNATQKKLAKRPPEDIQEYLLRKLWKIPELCEHFGLEVWNDE